MYQKPTVERFGTMRELTLAGFKGGSDGMTVHGISGDNCGSITQNPDGTYNYWNCERTSGM